MSDRAVAMVVTCAGSITISSTVPPRTSASATGRVLLLSCGVLDGGGRHDAAAGRIGGEEGGDQGVEQRDGVRAVGG
ncbi:hypothetical protein AB0N06_21060 [Streptomyces sp. NPDC051020]|uniref:hypothetical protein n=1 Tax=Streptomyces sp. NPDC051020 TaxID=3155409 RepID=UPI00342818B1